MREAESIMELLDEPLTRETLQGFKIRSLRKRVWYRVLSRMERGLVDLTIRWVDKIRNGTMRSVLVRILGKLARALETGMARVLLVGKELALKASMIAVEWGSHDAYAWRNDRSLWLGLGLAHEAERVG